MTLTAEARIETDRPSRYLVQLCEHANAMGGSRGRMHPGRRHHQVQVQAEWSDTHGVIRFEPWGRCTLDATSAALLLRVEATGEDGLRRLQDIIAADLARFGRRDHLTVSWAAGPDLTG
ncbi:hypothetical protein GCM10027176_00550 [Actinoallomurus bryophytorum]|uniref:DUF2218 domain-containing protein n=1 Tax=Actinoallomurus bryophytorum TaxID=1490222 RepID=A0A543CH67_9ACTN|nr:DUF2218 domain-containing protein [Actinoallomurus bryophytorum]TQL96453.1 hypothetical protein FB559_1982 [Actinoallomurus bryophytorum]